jgi:rhodanese-related sulfurtransferase
MVRLFIFFILVVAANSLQAQKTLDGLLASMNNETIPYVNVATLNQWMEKEKIMLLDSREREEFEVSHIPGAEYVGYKDFELEKVLSAIAEWNGKVVVYCSLGVRSEDIAEKMEKAGVRNLYNLYGGIFEWVNDGNEVVDTSGSTTDQVHAYNRFWGMWLNNGKKIYE